MKIAVILESWPKISERFIARDLAALHCHGFDFEIFALRSDNPALLELEPWSAVEAGITLPGRPTRQLTPRESAGMHPLAGALGSFLKAPRNTLACLRKRAIARELAAAVKDRGCSAVWSLWASLPGYLGMLAAEAAGLPFLLSGHARDLHVSCAFITRQLQAARLVLTCNSLARDHLAAMLPPGSRSKISLIRHGVPVPGELPDRSFPDNGKSCRILSVGRLVPKKAHDVLIRALAMLDSAVSLDIVGSGPLEKELRAQIAGLGLKDRVQLCGELSPSDLQERYLESDILVVSSRIAPDGDLDGVPNVMLEAAACGLPVIAADSGSVADFARDRETAMLIRSENPVALAGAISELIKSPELARHITAGALKLLRSEFSLQGNAQNEAALIRSVLD